MFDVQIAEIDAFVEESKTLAGLLQPWNQLYGRDHQARWGILDSLQIERGELCFAIDATGQRPTILATFSRRPFYRLDFVPQSECKPNPYGADAHGLPARVCGPHRHPWPANREYVRLNGFGELPFRQPVETIALSFDRLLEVAALDLNLTVTGVQRGIQLPPQSALFGEGGQ
jgi:hypothetical protein